MKRFLVVLLLAVVAVNAFGCAKSGGQTSGQKTSESASASQGATSSNAPHKQTIYEKAMANKPIFDLKIEKDKYQPIRDLLGEYYEDFIQKGIISSGEVQKVYAPETEIESVKTYGDNLVIVAFNGYIDDFNPNDIKIRARNSKWYSTNPSIVSRVETLNYGVGENGEGKTVVVLKLKTLLDGIRVKDDYFPVSVVSDGDKRKIITRAENALTWQIPNNGGWDKDYDLHITRKKTSRESYITKGSDSDGIIRGTCDNKATYPHIRLMASAYALSGDEKFKRSILDGIGFFKKCQYSSGAIPQFYPLRGNYSDNGTFNDNATFGVLQLFEDIINEVYPFWDIFDESQLNEIKDMFDRGIDYIIKCQVEIDGVKTAWCAQHHPVTYEPMKARAFEPVSLSGYESLNLIKLLMHQRSNDMAIDGANRAIDWYDAVAVRDMAYDKVGVRDEITGETKYFYSQEESVLWYRFYEIPSMKGIFGDRDGKVYYDVAEISEERRLGYVWADSWAKDFLEVYDEYGYYPNRIVALISSAKSSISNGVMKVGSTVDATENLAQVAN